jgi:hypothetical protein
MALFLISAHNRGTKRPAAQETAWGSGNSLRLSKQTAARYKARCLGHRFQKVYAKSTKTVVFGAKNW